MAESSSRFTVEHRPHESRYVLLDHGEATESGSVAEPQVIGQEAYAELAADGRAGDRVFYHTEVSKAYSGQGLAAVLVENAVDQAVSDGFLIAPVCPYVAGWFKKHPEREAQTVVVRPEHLAAIK